jgi:anti-anti-sigma factor
VTLSGDRLRVDAEGPGCLRAAGEIDVSTAGMLRRRILGLPHEVVQVDLSCVRFIDSSGLRVLLSTHGELASLGRRLELVDPSRSVRRLLELTALDRHLHIVEGTATAPGRD